MLLRNTEYMYEAGHWFYSIEEYDNWCKLGKPKTWKGDTPDPLKIAVWAGTLSGRRTFIRNGIVLALGQELHNQFPVAAQALVTGNFLPLADLAISRISKYGIDDYIRELSVVELGSERKANYVPSP
jgi:hypothetical protein